MCKTGTVTGNGESSTESAEQPSQESSTTADRWLTVPNVLSVLRVLTVPLFLYLLLGPHEDVWAIVLLAVSGFTDWLDGKLARWLNQYSTLGAMLDPVADRLYILATLVAFVIRDIFPWWAAALLVLKDVAVGLCLPLLRRRGYAPPDVHYIGKAATFVLLYAFPLLLLAQGTNAAARIAHPIATAFAVWGAALYVWTGVLYLIQVRLALRNVTRD